MKSLGLMTVLLLTTSMISEAKNIFGDVQITNIEPIDNFLWERENQNTPRYPIELARSGSVGCTILSFEISSSGDTENVEVVSSVPNKDIGKYSAKALKKWKWVLSEAESNPIAEKRTLRLDYCMGGESTDQSQAMCKQQVTLDCQ